MSGTIGSWISESWNAKAVTVAVIATTTGIAFVYLRLRKSDRTISRPPGAACIEYDRLMTDRKRKLFSELESLKNARGDDRLVLLEIGCGGGNNFKYYPVGSQVICVDPSRRCEAALYENIRQHPGVEISVFHVASAENMREVQSGSVDAVISTAVLCCVSDPDHCIQEIIRVLKPGGKLFLMEHVKSPPEFYVIRLAQMVGNLVWPFLHHGCHLTRTVQDNIRKAGFSSVDIEEFEAHEFMKARVEWHGIRLLRSHISGTATK